MVMIAHLGFDFFPMSESRNAGKTKGKRKPGGQLASLLEQGDGKTLELP